MELDMTGTDLGIRSPDTGSIAPNDAAKRNRPTPLKPTLNLYFKEKSPLRLTVVIPCVAVIVVFAAIFAKFAVIDRFAALAEREAELAREREAYEALVNSYADYDKVAEEYGKYSYTGYDRSIADRLDILDLLEREVFPVATVKRLSVSGNALSMTLEGLTLDQVSELLGRLEADPLVTHVTVRTTGYDAGDEGEPTANMTVELADATETEGSEG